jgi:hypothetical protein
LNFKFEGLQIIIFKAHVYGNLYERIKNFINKIRIYILN